MDINWIELKINTVVRSRIRSGQNDLPRLKTSTTPKKVSNKSVDNLLKKIKVAISDTNRNEKTDKPLRLYFI